jgi:uncharacterized protein
MIDVKRLVGAVMSHPLVLLTVGFVVTSFAYAVGQICFSLAQPHKPDGYVALAASLGAAALCIGVFWLFTRFVARQPFADFSRAGGVQQLLQGIAIGFAAMALTIGVIAFFGGYHITAYNGLHPLVGALAVGIISGVGEEIILRGVVFRQIEAWLGSWAALLASALLFGALHLANPNATALAAFAIALEAGVLLAAVYMVTRRLWAPIGLHAAWNFTQGGVFGVPVSGTNFAGMLSERASGPELLTGGQFGAEASLPAMIICTTFGLYFLLRARRAGQFVAPSWSRFKSGREALVGQTNE